MPRRFSLRVGDLVLLSSALIASRAAGEAVGMSLEDAFQEMKAGRPERALPHLVTMSRQNPTDAKVFETLGVCQMLAGKWDVADDSLERAIKLSKSPGRDLMVNRAIVGLRHKMAAPTVATKLATWIKASNVPADENLQNVFASLLNVMVEAGKSNTPVFQQWVSLYEFKNAELEANGPHPGMRRWGQEWVSKLEFDQKMNTFRSQRQEVWTAEDDVASSNKRLASEARAYENARRQALLRRRNAPANLSDAGVRDAQADLNRAQSRLERARDKMEYPTWATDYPPILPNLDNYNVASATPQQVPVVKASPTAPAASAPRKTEVVETPARPVDLPVAPVDEPVAMTLSKEPPEADERPKRELPTVVEPAPTATGQVITISPRTDTSPAIQVTMGGSFEDVAKALGKPRNKLVKPGGAYACSWSITEKIRPGIFDSDTKTREIERVVIVEFTGDRVTDIQEKLN